MVRRFTTCAEDAAVSHDTETDPSSSITTEEDTILPAQLYAEVRVLSHPNAACGLLFSTMRFATSNVRASTDRRGGSVRDALDCSRARIIEPFSFETSVRRCISTRSTCAAAPPLRMPSTRASQRRGGAPRRRAASCGALSSSRARQMSRAAPARCRPDQSRELEQRRDVLATVARTEAELCSL